MHSTAPRFKLLHSTASHLTLLHSTSSHFTSVSKLQPSRDVTAQHCSTLYTTAKHCTTLYTTAQHCSTLHTTAQHCSTLYTTAKHCYTLYTTRQILFTLYTTAQHCTTLYTTAQHCTALPHTLHFFTALPHTLDYCRALLPTLHNCTTLLNTLNYILSYLILYLALLRPTSDLRTRYGVGGMLHYGENPISGENQLAQKFNYTSWDSIRWLNILVATNSLLHLGHSPQIHLSHERTWRGFPSAKAEWICSRPGTPLGCGVLVQARGSRGPSLLGLDRDAGGRRGAGGYPDWWGEGGWEWGCLWKGCFHRRFL